VLGSHCRLLWAQPDLNLIGYGEVLAAETAMSYCWTTLLCRGDRLAEEEVDRQLISRLRLGTCRQARCLSCLSECLFDCDHCGEGNMTLDKRYMGFLQRNE
jgi:hypothetical protein